MEKILLVQTGFLGDVVLSTPVVSNLKRLHPDAEIVALTTPQAVDLLRFNPDLSRVLVFDKRGARSGFSGLLAMAAELRREQFSRVYSLHKSFRTAVLLALARIPLRFGFEEAAGAWLYHQTAARTGLGHDVLRNLAILTARGDVRLEGLEQEMCLGIPDAVVQAASSLLQNTADKPILAVASGSVWATKRWTAAGFADVIREFSSRGWMPVLIGGPGDSEVAEEVERLAGVEVLNLVAKTSLVEAAALVRKARILLTNDSAPLHLASAVKTPVVALFCATVPEFGYGPWRTASICLGVDNLKCRPCRPHGGNRCPTGTQACQLELKPERVIEAIDRLLERSDEQTKSSSNSRA